jgi:hypothetical protein
MGFGVRPQRHAMGRRDGRHAGDVGVERRAIENKCRRRDVPEGRKIG